MPNWCANHLVLNHSDLKMVDRALQALNRGELLQEFIPIPQELREHDPHDPDRPQEVTERLLEQYGTVDWYHWCLNNWGTKWDIGEAGCAVSQDDGSIQAVFDSAWSPPLKAYGELYRMGFDVQGLYYEPGMVFAGIWENGDDDYYSGWSDSREARDMLPGELDDVFGISESLEEFEREDMEDLHRWVEDGAKRSN